MPTYCIFLSQNKDCFSFLSLNQLFWRKQGCLGMWVRFNRLPGLHWAGWVGLNCIFCMRCTICVELRELHCAAFHEVGWGVWFIFHVEYWVKHNLSCVYQRKLTNVCTNHPISVLPPSTLWIPQFSIQTFLLICLLHRFLPLQQENTRQC